MTDETWTAAQVKEFVEAVLNEKDRAVAMADDEREKAAAALRSEQQRALDQATAERDKAASNLRIELARSMQEGDDRLREHITNQIMQINAALVSAEKLETTRIDSVKEASAALAEKLEVLRQAQILAQAKFERSVEGRFSQVNEFRGSLDDLGKTMATRRELEASTAALSDRLEIASTSLADRVEEARQERQHQIDDLRQTLAELRSRLDVGAPQIPELQQFVASQAGHRTGSQASIALILGLVGGLATIITIVIVLANVFTAH